MLDSFAALFRRAGRRFGFLKPLSDVIAKWELVASERPVYTEDLEGSFAKLFLEHDGRTVQKWMHYLPIYDELFEPFRRKGVRFLEIGISYGGSLELWRKFFGSDAVIAGVDIDPACADRVSLPNLCFIGSQDDPDFLRQVIAETGRPNIILDDGSHIARHQRTSFETLFTLLEDGGLYIIEDTHTSYWPDPFEGGLRRRGSAIEIAKRQVDDMHSWYHKGVSDSYLRDNLHCIRFYDSIIVFEKRKRLPPRHLRTPAPTLN